MSTVFRSQYSGSEIEEILLSVKDKINKSDIVNDFSGGAQKVASAESVKILKTWQNQFQDPEFVRTLYLTIPDSEIFTTGYKTSLEKLIRGFVGAFSTESERSTSLLNQTLVGKEVSLIIGQPGSLQRLQYYDQTTETWKDCVWTETPLPQEFESAGVQTVIRFPMSFTAAEYGVTLSNGSEMSVAKILIIHNGSQIQYTVNGSVEFGTAIEVASTFYDDGDVCVSINNPSGFTLKTVQTMRL